jgi:hypothetical protein
VNTVNTVGVIGKGVALEFKQRFPDRYEDFVQRCSRGEVRLGRPYLYRGLFPSFILDFPTKDHWRSKWRIVGPLLYNASADSRSVAPFGTTPEELTPTSSAPADRYRGERLLQAPAQPHPGGLGRPHLRP